MIRSWCIMMFLRIAYWYFFLLYHYLLVEMRFYVQNSYRYRHVSFLLSMTIYLLRQLANFYFGLLFLFRFTDGEAVKTFNCEQKSLWSPSSVVPDCVSEGIIYFLFSNHYLYSETCYQVAIPIHFNSIPFHKTLVWYRIICNTYQTWKRRRYILAYRV